jgi:hypothetical protein
MQGVNQEVRRRRELIKMSDDAGSYTTGQTTQGVNQQVRRRRELITRLDDAGS